MYDGENGWAIPTADEVGDPDRRDDLEAAALYDLIENDVAPRVLRPRRRRAAAPLAGHGAPHAAHRRPEGPREPDGARLRHPALHARRRRPVGPSTAPATSLPRTWRPGRTGCTRPGRPCAWTTSSPAASARARSSGRPLTLRVTVSLGELTPEDVVGGAAPRRGGRRRPARLADQRAACPWPRRRPTGRYRYDGACRSSAPGSFGYTVRVLPSNRLLANSAEMNLVALPAAAGAAADGPVLR